MVAEPTNFGPGGLACVIEAMRREYKGHPGVVDRVLQHVMSDPSFGKKHNLTGGGEELQLRGSDIGRLDQLLQAELDRTEAMNTHIEPLKREYGHMALGQSITRALGVDHGPANTTNFVPRFQNAIQEKVAYNCAVAVFDDNIKTLFSKDSDHFRSTVKERTELVSRARRHESAADDGSAADHRREHRARSGPQGFFGRLHRCAESRVGV